MARNSRKSQLSSQSIVLFPISQGAFGTMNLACYQNQAMVTIKSIEIIRKHTSRIVSEIAILETRGHPNIISHVQVLVTSNRSNFFLTALKEETSLT